jgi:DNA-binding response OmpR family regulator
MGVLLVDPDPGERFRLKTGLEAFGWCVWDAADGPTAVRTYADRRGAIRVAVVDLQLPGFEGSRVLAELSQLDPSLACCAMSAGVPPYAAAAFRRLSATPLFPKPVRIDHLDAALRELSARPAGGRRPGCA